MEILYMLSLNDIIWCLVDSIQLYYRIYRLWSSSMRGIVCSSNLQQFLMGCDDGFCGFEHSNGLNMGYDVQYLYMYIYIYMYIPSYTILQANKRHIKICLEGNESLLLVVRQGCWWIYWYDWKPAKTERWSNFSSWWLDILQLCGPQNITPVVFFWQQERIPSGKLT